MLTLHLLQTFLQLLIQSQITQLVARSTSLFLAALFHHPHQALTMLFHFIPAVQVLDMRLGLKGLLDLPNQL